MTIAALIKADLKSRIAAGDAALPGQLTLTALAQHYSVSFTPVRQAVNDLIAENYLEKGTNGRLACNARRRQSVSAAGRKPRSSKDSQSANGSPAAISTAPASLATRRREEAITAEVIRRSLVGKAGFLREELAAEEFGAGRSVIRRVFSTLAGQGLIEHVPRRGWRIRPYREADMLQYLDVRESLELRALELAWDKLNPARIQEFLERNSPSAARRLQIDNRLHHYWIEACGNRYISDFFTRHGGYFGALFDQAAMKPSVIRQAAAEHRGILKAILAGDKRLARRKLARHIRGQRPKVKRMYEGIEARGKG